MTWANYDIKLSSESLHINGISVMSAWETPAMYSIVDKLIRKEGSVLEIGYGMGISSDAILRKHPTSYTLIELNKNVMKIARKRTKNHTSMFSYIRDDWHNKLDIGKFDFIFFDTFDIRGQGNDYYVEFLKHCHNFMHEYTRLSIVIMDDKSYVETILPYFFENFEIFSQKLKNNKRTIYYPICSDPKDPLVGNRKKCQASNI